MQVGSIFRDIEQELNRVWGGGEAPGGAKTLLGQVDIKETKEAFIFKMDTPGLTKKNISVRVTPDNILVISGERSSEEHEEDSGYYRSVFTSPKKNLKICLPPGMANRFSRPQSLLSHFSPHPFLAQNIDA